MFWIQVLELICTREAGAVFEAGGLQCSLTFIREFGSAVHKDTLHSAMNVVTRLCGRMEPQDTNLETCVKSLSTLLKHEDPYVSAKISLTVFNNYGKTHSIAVLKTYSISVTKSRTQCLCSGDLCEENFSCTLLQVCTSTLQYCLPYLRCRISVRMFMEYSCLLLSSY